MSFERTNMFPGVILHVLLGPLDLDAFGLLLLHVQWLACQLVGHVGEKAVSTTMEFEDKSQPREDWGVLKG